MAEEKGKATQIEQSFNINAVTDAAHTGFSCLTRHICLRVQSKNVTANGPKLRKFSGDIAAVEFYPISGRPSSNHSTLFIAASAGGFVITAFRMYNTFHIHCLTASPSAVHCFPTPFSILADQEKGPLCFHTSSLKESNKVTEAPIEPSPSAVPSSPTPSSIPAASRSREW
ncbi:Uncharacterized protein Adt_09482 [Abeliophyllum distichum]|uniref:Uncharacterized protein n=1 Tax=Abeliophyllum distichum TaxID=126358 RepID=A0ABD1UHA7_9LAMI